MREQMEGFYKEWLYKTLKLLCQITIFRALKRLDLQWRKKSEAGKKISLMNLLDHVFQYI